MSSDPTDDDDRELLAEVLAGVRPETDPAVEALFARRPQARAEFDELQALAAELNAAGAADRAELDDALQQAESEGAAELRAFVARHRPLGGGPRATGRRRWLLVAAALLVAAVAGYLALRSPPADKPVFLDGYGPGAEHMQPSGRVDRIEAFSWALDVGEGHTYRVFVYAADDELRRDPILESKELDEPRWNPTDAERRTLPRRFSWEVVVYDEFSRDAKLGSWARCERSP